MDGREEERRGAVSVFNGPAPETGLFPSVAGEREAVAAFLRRAVSDGAAPEEIGVFVREREALGRAHEAIRAAGLEATLLPPVLRQAVPHPGASAVPDEGSAPPPDAPSAPHGVTETAEAPIAAG